MVSDIFFSWRVCCKGNVSHNKWKSVWMFFTSHFWSPLWLSVRCELMLRVEYRTSTFNVFSLPNVDLNGVLSHCHSFHIFTVFPSTFMIITFIKQILQNGNPGVLDILSVQKQSLSLCILPRKSLVPLCHFYLNLLVLRVN